MIKLNATMLARYFVEKAHADKLALQGRNL
jgi:hypothetical protein